MAQLALIRASIAVAAAFTIMSGLGGVAAPAAHADTPSETVIPAALSEYPRMDTVDLAGPGGFLHRNSQTGWVWTKYSGGPDIPVPGTYTDAVGSSGAGSDVVAAKSAGGITLRDMDAGTTTTIVLPSGQSYLGTFGSSVLTTEKAADGTITALHILTMTGGQQTDTQVAGWSAGSSSWIAALAGNANSAVVKYRLSTGDRFALLDLTTSRLTPIFGTVGGAALPVLTDTYVGWYSYEGSGTLHLLRRSDLSAPETAIQVPLPSSDYADVHQIGIVGESLLVTYDVYYSTPSYSILGNPLYTVPLAGGTPTRIVDHVGPRMMGFYSGGAVVVGGSSVTDWAARQVTIGADGTPVLTAVDSDPPMPSPTYGVSLAGGQLLTVEPYNTPGLNVFARTIQLGDPPSYGARTAFETTAVSDCVTPSTRCGPVGTGDGRVSLVGPGSNGESVSVQGPTSGSTVNPGASHTGTLVDSDGRFVVFDDPYAGQQYIGDITVKTSSNVLFSRALTAAALSGESLWVADSAAGSISSIDLATRQTTKTVTIGAPCVPSELQAAAGRWIYWSCGASGPTGVYDLATHQDVTVPSGPAELGDGFVVEHDMAAGKLVLTDVHTGTAVTSDLAALPALAGLPSDDRRVTWAVDKYSGGIGYVDAQQNVHIVDPHIPASPASGYRMLPGQRLNPGDSLSSGSMRLAMQSDGNLVAYLKAGGSGAPAEWASGTWGHPGAYAVMQPDGNLVVYSQNGGPGLGGVLWSSNTSGNAGAYAVLQDDGNLVVYRQGTSDPGNAVWASGSYARSRTIASGETLEPGWWTQGQYTFLVMQPDGNLVLYRKRDGAAIWASRTWGDRGAYAVMQSDGNLVVYRQGGGPGAGGALWATGTWRHAGAYALMQNDGNLVVYRQGGGPGSGGALWASNTWQTSH